MTGDTLHGDGVKSKFGTGGDLEIYHTGSASYIDDKGTGDLNIRTSELYIEKYTGEVMLRAVGDGAVSLYYNNAAKLATTSTGVSLTGTLSTGKVLLNDNGNSTIAGLQLGNQGIGLSVPTTDTMHFLTADQTRMMISSAGKVGIGRTPTASYSKLEVGGADNTALINTEASGVFAGLGVQSGGLGLYVNNSNKMTINSSGKVGIGTNAIGAALHVDPAANVTTGFGAPLIKVGGANSWTGNGSLYSVGFGYVVGAANKSPAEIGYATTNAGGSTKGDLVFATRDSTDPAVAPTERMRIDSAGTMLIQTGGAAPSSSQEGISLGLSGPNGAKIVVANTLTSTFAGAMVFINGNGQVGTISTSGSATSYNTSSDYRLKTDVQPMTGATATFMQLKPCNFEWIADGTRVDGFLAHELGEVIPAAATGSKDAMKDEEYEVSPATGDVYTAAIAEVATESQVMETVETGSYVNLAGETIVETEERGVTTDLVETVVQRQDIDGVSTEVEVEVTTKVPTMKTVITTPAVAEVINISDVELSENLEEGQQWRETTAQVMATRSVPDMQGIDQAKVVPLLVATLQEALARIEALEA